MLFLMILLNYVRIMYLCCAPNLLEIACFLDINALSVCVCVCVLIAHQAGPVCQILTYFNLHRERLGLSKIAFFGPNYSTAIWLNQVVYFGEASAHHCSTMLLALHSSVQMNFIILSEALMYQTNVQQNSRHTLISVHRSVFINLRVRFNHLLKFSLKYTSLRTAGACLAVY